MGRDAQGGGASLKNRIEPGVYRLIGFLTAVSASLLIAQSWRERYAMNEDGMSYLDMADRMLLGDSGAWLHSYWSPLYPGLLGITFKAIPPDAAAKFPLVHSLNCLIGLAALASFTFFVTQWLRSRDGTRTSAGPLVLFAYACFLWSALEITGIQTVSPDMLINALVFLTAGLVCFLSRRKDGERGPAVLLGLVLGVAYLAKAVMLVFGVFLLALLWTPWFARMRRRDVAAAGIAFALTAGVQVGFLSARLGKFSISESGRLNYAWFVQEGVPRVSGWTGDDPRHGTPLHPPRRVRQQPEVLEFNYPEAEGTYPLWYDPVFFHAGLQIHFDPRKQLAQLAIAPNMIRWSHGRNVYPLLVGLLVLAWFARRDWRLAWSRSGGGAWMVLWPAAAIGLYAVVSVTPRYLAPFLVLIWMWIYNLLQPARITGIRGARIQSAIYVVVALFVGAISIRSALLTPPAAPTAYLVSVELAGLGLRPGDSIATLGKGIDDYYAHLAKLRIIADIDPEESFWRLPQAEAEELEHKLREAGAMAIVSQRPCPASAGPGWRELGRAAYCLKMLPDS